MIEGLSLGYLVFEVRNLSRWRAFCAEMLALPAPIENADGSIGFRIDDRTQRLIVTPGRQDDLVALGLECASDAVLEARVARLTAAGIAVVAGDRALCASRRVRRLVRFADPAGNQVELFVGAERAAEPFHSEAFPGGFVTGDLGLGHAVLIHDDIAAMEHLYVDVLGFGVSDRLDAKVGPMDVRGVFLHCNARHHSLAVMNPPLRRRCHHFMLEAAELFSVGSAYERARRFRVPISLSLGQHPDPDATFSFYGTTPSGFDFEIGYGSGLVEPATWTPTTMATTSSWGHIPTFRLKWNTLRAVVASRFRGRPAAQL